MIKFDYCKNDIRESLLKVGLSCGDNIFIHSNLGFFGRLMDGITKEDYCKAFKESIFDIIGPNGTLVVPTFSYSFCNGQIYDKTKTPGIRGMFSEYIRLDSEAIRSDDANFSIAAIGKNAEYFTKDAPSHSFGSNSFWERFLQYNGKICNLNFDSGSTFIHYVEKLLKVKYRYDKGFHGKSIINHKEKDDVFYHFVYDLTKPNNGPDFSKFDRKAKNLGLVKTTNLGKGQIVLISSTDVLSIIKNEIITDPAFLIRGNVVE